MTAQAKCEPDAVMAPASGRRAVRQALLDGAGPRTLTLDRLALDDGSVLAPVTLAFETWGTLSPTADNVVLLCHALTGSAHARDDEQPDDPRAGWWNPLVGPGRVFDTDRYLVVCSNVLGGCSGSTGPASWHPADGQPYGLRFPHVTVGDIVRAQRELLQRLDIERVAVVAGGSLGGQQALEWTIAYPDAVDRAIVIAASARLSAQGLAIDDIARQAIMADPAWRGGAYRDGAGPDRGLAIARMLAMLTYMSAGELEQRFGRRPAARASDWPAFGPRLDIESYLHYQGEKLVRRFDANTYLYLSSAMDCYDAADGSDRGSDAAAFTRVRADVLAVGITSDWLYPPAQVSALADGIVAAGGRARYAEVVSLHGHDAFLKEWEQMDALLRPFLSSSRSPSERR
jgi:homoserine O-acetyltransferase/O-succinyltransferase